MTATLDTAADTTDVATAPTTATVAATTEVPASTRESRRADRVARTEAERGQYVHGFVWATIGLIVSLAAFGLIAMKDAEQNRPATSVSSSTTP